MYFLRDLFNQGLWKPNRLVFMPGRPPDKCEIVIGEGGRIEKPEDKEKAERERERITSEAQDQRELEQAKIERKIESEGTVEDYVKAFDYTDKATCYPRLDVLVELLKVGMEREGSSSLFNFDNWLIAPPEEIGALFENAPFMPHGIKGKKAFVEGLKKQPPDKEVVQALTKIVGHLSKYSDEKRKAGEDLSKQKEKSDPLTGTATNWWNNLMKNYTRGSQKEKLMTFAAGSIMVGLIWKYWDAALFGDKLKVSTVAKIAAALWGINYLSGQVSSDGKTLVQRVDLCLDLENMQDNVYKGYAYEHGMDQNQEKLRTFVLLQNKSMAALFRLYAEAAPKSAAKVIDPKRLGFFKGEIDGKLAYEIVEELVQETSVNEGIRRKKEKAAGEGIEYTPPTKDQIEHWRSTGPAIEAFTEKYITGELGKKSDPTLADVVFNEYQGRPWQQAITEGKARRLSQRAYRKTSEMFDDALDATKYYGAKAGRYIVRGAKGAWEVSRDYVLVPAWKGMKWVYEKAQPYTVEPLQDALCWWQEKDLKKVLPEEFAVDVYERGTASIMGLPAIPFEIAKENEKEKITIKIAEGKTVEFFVAEGIVKAKIDQLAAEIKTFVESLVENRTQAISPLRGKKPEWDPSKKTWTIKGVDIQGKWKNTLGLDAKQIDVRVSIEKDRSVKFYSENKEITDFDNIDETYRDSQVQEKLWEFEFGPSKRKHLKGLPVAVESVTADKTHGAIIKGTIAGLKFQAVPKNKKLQDGIQFYDGASVDPNGSRLKIEHGNGGDEFRKQMAAKIFEEDFARLEHIMNNTPEPVLQHFTALFQKRKLWIFPANAAGIINGPILENLWRSTIQFKKLESVDMFSQELDNKTLKQIDDVYDKKIARAHDTARKMADSLEKMRDDQIADQFPDLLAELETLNYSSAEYVEYFKKYKEMITAERFDYLGADKVDPIRGYEVYQTLMAVWSHNTGMFADMTTLDAGARRKIEEVISKVRAHLEKAQASRKLLPITKDSLPAADTEDELENWVK